jgi:hypothetical protein
MNNQIRKVEVNHTLFCFVQRLSYFLFFFTLLEGNISYQYPDIMKKLDGIPQLLPGSSPLSIHDQEVHTGNWNPNLQKVRDNTKVLEIDLKENSRRISKIV